MADRPNLVFIFSDQQRYDTMACYGNTWINTPNLNQLALRSFIFRNAYVTQPVCTPSRASIMTGLYPHTAGPVLNGIPLPADVPCFPEMAPSDYHYAYLGKWHLGHGDRAQHGFTTWVSTEDGHGDQTGRGAPVSSLSNFHQHLLDNGFKPDRDSGELMTFTPNGRTSFPAEYQMAPYLGDRAAEFIDGNGDRPFVMYVSCVEPHSPYVGPMQDMYNPPDLPVGPTFLKRPGGASLLHRVKADYYLRYLDGGDPSRDDYMTGWAAVGEDVTTEAGWRALRAHYFASVSLVDMMVGKITAALERNGLSDNTIVVFTSDHGDLLGDHGMLEKRSFYEESARVPLLMSVPSLGREQKEIGGSFGHIDLVPTLLDLLGESIPRHLHGQSRRAVLEGRETLEDTDVVVEWNGIRPGHFDRGQATPEVDRLNHSMWRSIITHRWKLNLCAGDQCELFDLNTDPWEENNLFDDPAQADRIRDMAARLRVWQHLTDDTASLPDV